MPATVEELIALVLSLQERVAKAEARAEAAEARVAKLEAENAELRARLGKDSSNSSKPPSTDSPYKVKPPVQRGLRKAGGQKGHKGATRTWLPPDKVHEHKLVRVPVCVCGTALGDVSAMPTGTRVRQVVEVPAIEPHVTQYRFESVRCPCCARVNVPLVPPEAATSTGPNLTALTAALVGDYHLSRDAAASLLGAVLHMPICPATVQSCCEQVSAGLATATAEVDAALPSSNVIHMDETSWKRKGVLEWLWIGVGDQVTSYGINARRGRPQLDKWFPKGFSGIVNCDRWRPYELFFDRRQLCWSHLERDLQALIDLARHGAGAATDALAGAHAMFKTWRQFKFGVITRIELQKQTEEYRRQFMAFCAAGEAQKRDTRWRAVGKELLRQRDDLFRFLDVDGVEPTNNTAEQGLRSAVIWRRTTQGTRTDAGSTFVQRIMTAQANCKRQGRSVLRFLADTLLAHRQGLTPPSLLPMPP